MNRLLLILAIVAAQLFAGPSTRVAMSAEVHARAAIAREGNDATRLEANVPSARRSALQIARLRSRTRLQRATPASSVAQVMTARFASIVAHRPITEGAINTGRFIALGLPDTRAP